MLRDLKKNQRGVALLLVMSAIFMLTTVIVEFAFRTNVQYHLALNNADRLQAYYLAESALNFSKLLIKYDKDIQKRIADANVSVTVEPLYSLFPMNTGLLRAAASGELSGEPADAGGETGTEEEAEPNAGEPATGEEDQGKFSADLGEAGGDEGGVSTGLSVLQSDEAKDFLAFSGDFELEVGEIERKLDLNVFYELANTQPDYDARKRWLTALLKMEPFAAHFEKREDDLTAAELVYRLTDWVDQNDAADEIGAVSRGNESVAYKDVDYSPKNGKLVSLEEIGLVPGMSPSFLAALEPYLTPYSTSHKWNACFAEEKLVDALVVMYSETNTCLSPLDPEKDADKITELRTAFLGGCPKPEDMTKLLDEAFGLELGGEEETATKDCGKLKLQDLLTSDYKLFELTGRGTVGETTVEIRTVLNTTDDNPDRWAFYYWRVN